MEIWIIHDLIKQLHVFKLHIEPTELVENYNQYKVMSNIHHRHLDMSSMNMIIQVESCISLFFFSYFFFDDK